MKWFCLAVILLPGCTREAQVVDGKQKRYCIHNGSAAWNPVCNSVSYGGGILRAFDCHDFNESGYIVTNPTNVTECWQ